MKQFVKRLMDIIRPHWRLEILGFFLTLIYSVFVFLIPMSSRYLIDQVIPAKSNHILYEGLLIFFIVCAMQPLVGLIRDILFLNISERITKNIRERLFYKSVNSKLAFFDRIKKGEFISRIMNDGRSASDFIRDFFIVFLSDIILLMMVLAGMLYISLKISVTVILVFMILLFVNVLLSRKLKGMSAQIQKSIDEVCVEISQMSDRIIGIKSFTLETAAFKKFQVSLGKLFKHNLRVNTFGMLLNRSLQVVGILALCIIYGMGAFSVMEGTMTLGDIIALGLYFQLLIQPVNELVNNHMDLQKSIPIFDRLFEFFDEPDEDPVKKNTLKSMEGDIRFRNVTFSYKDSENSLEDINIFIENKSFVALVGSSGSGKSTMAKLLMGFYFPQQGDILIGENPIDVYGLKTLRRSIGYVSQEIDLLNATIMENLSCGNHEVDEWEAISMCKLLNIHEKIMELPHGYQSMIDERVNLSGGEKQRLGVARALLKKPAILILDEPTSALDSENVTQMKEVIENLKGLCTIIMITHHLSTIVNADTIFVFEKGKVKESGNHEKLLKNSGIYSKFYLQ